jgi:hypothetical protein
MKERHTPHKTYADLLTEQADPEFVQLIQDLDGIGNVPYPPMSVNWAQVRTLHAEQTRQKRRAILPLRALMAVQNSRRRIEQQHPKEQALHMSVKKAQPMKTNMLHQSPAKNRRHALETFATILVVMMLVGSMALLFRLRQIPQSSQGSEGTANSTVQGSHRAAVTPEPPTSVTLRASAPGISPTTQSVITIPSGTTVTLTVIPDHSLLPFQTFTMGIYATDPYKFSGLQYCTYPKTDTCSYTIAYSSSEQTDYTKGKHTFKAFLGNTGGAILENSNSITIAWL